MKKQVIGAMMLGAGLTAVGLVSMSNMKKSKAMKNAAYMSMNALKEEFADEAGHFAKMAGNGMIKAGKKMNRFMN